MSYLAEDFDEIKDLRDQHLKNHPSFEAQNLLTGHVFKTFYHFVIQLGLLPEKSKFWKFFEYKKRWKANNEPNTTTTDGTRFATYPGFSET